MAQLDLWVWRVDNENKWNLCTESKRKHKPRLRGGFVDDRREIRVAGDLVYLQLCLVLDLRVSLTQGKAIFLFFVFLITL